MIGRASDRLRERPAPRQVAAGILFVVLLLPAVCECAAGPIDAVPRSADGPNLYSLGSSVVGAAIGALLAFLLTYANTVRENRRKRTLDLLAEFNTEEMDRSRVIATALLMDNLSNPHPLTYTEMSNEKVFDVENFHHVCRVIHFFERLCILREEGYLDDRLLRRTLWPYLEKYNDQYLRGFAALTLQRDPGTHVIQWVDVISRSLP